MAEMTGVVTIVQEGRFQLTDELGRSHLFMLGPNAPLETSQLRPLSAAQTKVRVKYDNTKKLIALRANDIEVV
jgi:hypothetical protein